MRSNGVPLPSKLIDWSRSVVLVDRDKRTIEYDSDIEKHAGRTQIVGKIEPSSEVEEFKIYTNSVFTSKELAIKIRTSIAKKKQF